MVWLMVWLPWGVAAWQTLSDPLAIKRISGVVEHVPSRGVKGFGADVWSAITEPYTSRWNAGRYGEAVGYGIGDVILTVVGAKGATKIG